MVRNDTENSLGRRVRSSLLAVLLPQSGKHQKSEVVTTTWPIMFDTPASSKLRTDIDGKTPLAMVSGAPCTIGSGVASEMQGATPTRSLSRVQALDIHSVVMPL